MSPPSSRNAPAAYACGAYAVIRLQGAPVRLHGNDEHTARSTARWRRPARLRKDIRTRRRLPALPNAWRFVRRPPCPDRRSCRRGESAPQADLLPDRHLESSVPHCPTRTRFFSHV